MFIYITIVGYLWGINFSSVYQTLSLKRILLSKRIVFFDKEKYKQDITLLNMICTSPIKFRFNDKVCILSAVFISFFIFAVFWYLLLEGSITRKRSTKYCSEKFDKIFKKLLYCSFRWQLLIMFITFTWVLITQTPLK